MITPRRVALAAVAVAICWGIFWYSAINAFCDDDYWPEWA